MRRRQNERVRCRALDALDAPGERKKTMLSLASTLATYAFVLSPPHVGPGAARVVQSPFVQAATSPVAAVPPPRSFFHPRSPSPLLFNGGIDTLTVDELKSL